MAAAPFSIPRRQALSIHSRLMMLTVVTVLPLVAVGGFAIIRTVDDQKVQVEQAVGKTVDGLLGDIDRQIIAIEVELQVLAVSPSLQSENLYGFPEISGHECDLIGSMAGTSYRAGEAGAQATAQSERTRPWLLANLFQAISLASMMSARLGNTELASQWLRR